MYDCQVCGGTVLFIIRGSRHTWFFRVCKCCHIKSMSKIKQLNISLEIPLNGEVISVVQYPQVSKLYAFFHIFANHLTELFFLMICVAPFVTDYLCEPSQQAAPSHEQLSEQLCGDLHPHSPGNPSSSHTLFPALCATKCKSAHRCERLATTETLKQGGSFNLVLLSFKIQAIMFVVTASHLSKQRTKWRPTSWSTTTE